MPIRPSSCRGGVVRGRRRPAERRPERRKQPAIAFVLALVVVSSAAAAAAVVALPPLSTETMICANAAARRSSTSSAAAAAALLAATRTARPRGGGSSHSSISSAVASSSSSAFITAPPAMKTTMMPSSQRDARTRQRRFVAAVARLEASSTLASAAADRRRQRRGFATVVVAASSTSPRGSSAEDAAREGVGGGGGDAQRQRHMRAPRRLAEYDDVFFETPPSPAPAGSSSSAAPRMAPPLQYYVGDDDGNERQEDDYMSGEVDEVLNEDVNGAPPSRIDLLSGVGAGVFDPSSIYDDDFDDEVDVDDDEYDDVNHDAIVAPAAASASSSPPTSSSASPRTRTMPPPLEYGGSVHSFDDDGGIGSGSDPYDQDEFNAYDSYDSYDDGDDPYLGNGGSGGTKRSSRIVPPPPPPSLSKVDPAPAVSSAAQSLPGGGARVGKGGGSGAPPPPPPPAAAARASNPFVGRRSAPLPSRHGSARIVAPLPRNKKDLFTNDTISTTAAAASSSSSMVSSTSLDDNDEKGVMTVKSGWNALVERDDSSSFMGIRDDYVAAENDSLSSSSSSSSVEIEDSRGAISPPPPPPIPPPPPPPSRPEPLTTTEPAPGFLSESCHGNGVTSRLDILTKRLDSIQRQIYDHNGNKPFNVNSPRQVAEVLFGKGDASAGQSTNKDVLEAMASAGNVMADLVLTYRKTKRDLTREKTRLENRRRGTHVQRGSEGSSARTVGAAVAATAGGGSLATEGQPAAASPPTSSLEGGGAKDDKEKGSAVVRMEEDEAHASNGNGGDPLLLVDASAYIFRAYYSMPPLHRYDGEPVGALLGFCNMLNRIVLHRTVRGERPRIVLVFDAQTDDDGPKTFRHELYPEYKGNRKPCPEDLVPQFDFVREAADAYGIVQVEAPSYEADDVIATLADMAVREGVDVNILSGDKDLMQLVTPPDSTPCIHMIDPKNMVRFTHDVVVDKWGVPPDKLGDVLALAGDSSDNIPGVSGIGPKIAAALINEYGTLDSLLENVDKVKQKGRREKLLQNADKARLSRKLVNLKRSIPAENMTMPSHLDTVSDFRMAPLDTDRLLGFYDQMGLRDMKQRVRERLGIINGDVSAPGPAPDTKSAALSPSAVSQPQARGGVASSDGPFDTEEGSSGAVPGGNSGQNTRGSGLFVQRRKKWASPPSPEEYKDVPF